MHNRSDCPTVKRRTLPLLMTLLMLATSSPAQQPPWSGEIFEIVVTAPRVEVRETRLAMGRGARVSMSYTVGFADLDLTSEEGRTELEERINEAANEMCLLLTERYAGSRSGAASCARDAINDAMPRVQAAIEAAEQR